MRVYGYVRVSSIDQNEDRQMVEMEQRKVSKGTFMSISNRARILNGRSIRK